MNMFMFSLAGDAREWYHSLPHASISSLGEFHVAFNAHCQKFYPSELICHSCCEGYNDYFQDRAASYAGCEDESDDLDHKSVLSHPYSSTSEESCMDEDEEEEEALSEPMEMVKSLSADLEELKAEHECCLFEENAEDFPSLEEDVLGSSIEYDVEDLMTVEALHPAPVVSCFDDYSYEEQQSPTSQIDDQRSNQPVYDNYESDFELDMQDIQEHTTDPYPLFLKGDYREEISHPRPAEDTEA
jgi:hypothetical protein